MNTTTSSAHPGPLARLITRIAPVEPREVGAVLAAFFLFFFMWAGYFSVRPVRETVATLLGRQAVADLWLYTSAFSILIVPVYGAVVARFKRSTFLPWTYGIVAVALAGGGLLLDPAQFNPVLGKSFYVFISVVNLFLLSMFWSFLLEIFDKAQTKRLFGVIAAGGSAGALAGPLLSDLTVTTIGEAPGANHCSRPGNGPASMSALCSRVRNPPPVTGSTSIAQVSPTIIGVLAPVVTSTART